MKARLILVVTLLFLFSTLSLAVRAQETIDKKIQSVEQEIETLKKQKLAALEKKKEELKKEIAELEQGHTPNDDKSADTKAETTAVTTAGDPAKAAVPETNSAVKSGAGPVKNNLVNAKFEKAEPPKPVVGESVAVSPSPLAALKKAAAAAPAGSPATTNSLCLAVALEPAKYTKTEQEICNLAISIVGRRASTHQPTFGMDLSDGDNDAILEILAEKLATAFGATDTQFNKAVTAYLLEAEQARTDKQAGADSKSSGTTSLAVKGGVPAFLSWAMENGGVEGSRDGNAITFRVNPIGLADSLANWGTTNGLITPAENKGLDQLFHDKDDGLVRALKNTSLGFSFDISRGTDPPTLIGSKQQLSAVSFRYQFLNRRDPRNSRYKNEWAEFRLKQQHYSDQIAHILPGLITFSTTGSDHYTDADLNGWFQAANAAVKLLSTANMDQNAAVEAVRVIVAQQVDKMPVDKLKTNTAMIAQLNSFFTEFVTLNDALTAVLKKVAKGDVATFEYTNYRNVNAPDLSNFRFILSKGFWQGADATFNASLTMYNKKPASTDPAAKLQRIRDFDFTGQLDIPFSSFIKRAQEDLAAPGPDVRTPLLGIPVLTFAGKYQRLQSDAVMPDGAVKTGTRGDLAFGQLKLTIPINFNGLSFKLPFSITLANRTDLIKEKDVRGNFGFTLDIDPFFTMLKNSLSGSLFRP